MSTTSVMHVLNLGCFWSLDIPYTYIEYILNHIGAADTLEKIEALLPWNVPLERVEKKQDQLKSDK
ncbi:MAG: transposase domain-containing protein [Gammaproteobacteria bacterium]|jgi:hypothetical protein|nr:transposase domain-containing protein [Gammaproteobacteria bacterium]MBT4812754.1 transposase domain-containing protein [Thiotrichales bacterium]MBT4331424.1 transposase domain-containing protein [Gammaproteobacteria bacterium]MBT5635841.1 transposase domain-containing protein [Gammaproteobacteria bacterium]MBT7229626.1 transposase domain-containing protein [Gammaproteobacteria bacterium]